MKVSNSPFNICDSTIADKLSQIYFEYLFSDWKEIIEKRVFGFTWCMDKLFLPPDPYGRSGPSLDEILHKKQAAPTAAAAPTEAAAANANEKTN